MKYSALKNGVGFAIHRGCLESAAWTRQRKANRNTAARKSKSRDLALANDPASPTRVADKKGDAVCPIMLVLLIAIALWALLADPSGAPLDRAFDSTLYSSFDLFRILGGH